MRSPAYIETMARERGAFLSLALTQRRLAQTYRVYARMDRDAGKTESFLRNAAEARRLFRDAQDNLQFAKSRTV